MKKNIYKDFCEHTGLKDSVYESVFLKISETLNKLNDIQWLYLTYTDKDSDGASTSIINFKKESTVPLYIIELIKNAFGNYYTLPKSVVVTLGLLYKDQEYNVICSSEETIVPDELQFLKFGNIFNTFFITHPVRDIFEEYDNIFSFMNDFKPIVKRVFPALEKKFDINSSKDFVDQENLTTKDIANSQLLIEALEEQISNYMNQMEQIKIEKENIRNKKDSSISSVSNRGELVAEKNRLINEHEMLRVTVDDYNIRLEKLDKIISDIDSELSWALDRNGSEEDITFLKDKRIVFEHDQVSLEKTKQDILKLIKTSEISIDTIDKQIKSSEQLTEDDLINMDNQIQLLDNKQDSLYAELLRDDSKLKNLKSQSLNKQLKIEQSQTYADMTIQTIEHGSIINHLATPLQPISVTTVANYLRYYFCYHVTLFANNLLDKNSNENIYTIQALATKLTLLDIFGLKLNTIFSVFPILVHDNINNILIITKE